jgi:3-hydroxyisobutyrate dehydrogenase-like beta-hydroxyacid dehydrogenase
MTRIAFMGLGLMGEPMAGRLVDAGHDVAVWNRTASRAEALRERGAEVAATPAEAAAGRDVAITMLTDADALDGVLFGGDGAAAALAQGSLLIDMSTVGRDAVLAVADRLPGGVEMLDSPVTGSTPRAEAGELTILVGGTAAAYERARPVLEVLGTPRRVGDLGSGAAMKLVSNSTLGAILLGIGEALALGDALGLDRGAVLDLLENSYLGGMVKTKRAMLDSGEYPPQFKLSLAAKDLRLVERAAAAGGRALRGSTVAREAFDAAEEAGRGDEDYAALVAWLEGA